MSFDALGEGYPPNDLLCAVFSGDDVCPKCLGELDTGWECTVCGYDSIRHVFPKRPDPSPPRRTDSAGRDVTDLPGLWDESDTLHGEQEVKGGEG